MSETTETPPLIVNGKHYPLWSQFVEKQAEWIGGTLEDHDYADDVASTTIKAARLAGEEAERAKGEEARFNDFINDLELLGLRYSFQSAAYSAAYSDAIRIIDDVMNGLIAFRDEQTTDELAA